MMWRLLFFNCGLCISGVFNKILLLIKNLAAYSNLRELKLAFERAGEEGCQHPKNMRQRDRLEIISAAPGISSYNYFKPKKRKKEESSDDDDEAETLHMLRKQRRMRNKKLKEFFNKTFSDTESMMSDSSNKSLSSIRSDNPGSESEVV